MCLYGEKDLRSRQNGRWSVEKVVLWFQEQRTQQAPPRDWFGFVARAVLHQLESLGVVEKDGKGGRVITASGMRDLDRIAGRVKVDHKMI